MAFSLHDFVLQTCLGMVGKEPDYKVSEYALGWYNKSILTQADVAQVSDAIDKHNAELEAAKKAQEDAALNPPDELIDPPLNTLEEPPVDNAENLPVDVPVDVPVDNKAEVPTDVVDKTI